jgi:nucleoside-diphosphate-sugar epimerase
LILGFTGGIGRAVALALSNRDLPIRVLVRNAEKAYKYASGLKNIEILEGDADKPEDVEKAMAGAGFVYYCVNVPYQKWEKDAIRLFNHCLAAAIKQKAKLIFPGNVYVYGHAKYYPVDEKHPHAAHTKKGQIRMEMEEMLAVARKKENLDYCIVRMPDFYGPYVINSFSEKLYIAALKSKAVDWIGDLDAEIELIYIEDGGEAMVMAALSEKSSAEIFNMPGSDIITARNYLSMIVEQAGSKSKIGTLNAEWLFILLGIFIPVIKEVREMLYLKREKLILDGTKFDKLIGTRPSTDYATGIRNTLNWVRDYFDIK